MKSYYPWASFIFLKMQVGKQGSVGLNVLTFLEPVQYLSGSSASVIDQTVKGRQLGRANRQGLDLPSPPSSYATAAIRGRMHALKLKGYVGMRHLPLMPLLLIKQAAELLCIKRLS